jgi:ribosome-associated protein
VVIHVQHAEERIYYALERIWKDCPQIPLPELVGVGSVPPGGRPPGISPRLGENLPPQTPSAPDGRTR